MRISVLLVVIAAYIATHASAQNELERPWEDTWSDHSSEKEESLRSMFPKKMHWEDCDAIPMGMELPSVKCAWLKVPVTDDDKKNDVPSWDKMIIPIIKVTPGIPKRTVFYSPGELGADWTNDQLYNTDGLYKRLQKTLGRRTEIIVVGNRYTNWTSCLPENKELRFDLTPGKKMFIDSDVDKNLKKMWRKAEDYKYGCGNFKRKEYGLPYLGTKWAAKDLDRVRKKLGLEKISFLGESIGGTILGIEYARMFPDRVERMALDGVAPYSWYSQEHDPEEIAVAAGYWNKLWAACHKAGPRGYCGFYHDDIEEIRTAFFRIGSRLQRERYLLDIHGHPNENHIAPVSVVFDEQMWLKYVLQSMNDKTARKSIMNIASAISKNESRALASDPGRHEPKWTPKETTYFIASIDQGGLQKAPTVEEIRSRFFPKNVDILELGTDWTALLTAAAMNLTSVDPPSRYPANVTAPPILFIGNTGDTRTPLSNARNWQEKAFPYGRLLTIDGIGHGLKDADIESKCAKKYLSKYFMTGELPPEGTICEGLQFPEF